MIGSHSRIWTNEIDCTFHGGFSHKGPLCRVIGPLRYHFDHKFIDNVDVDHHDELMKFGMFTFICHDAMCIDQSMYPLDRLKQFYVTMHIIDTEFTEYSETVTEFTIRHETRYPLEVFPG